MKTRSIISCLGILSLFSFSFAYALDHYALDDNYMIQFSTKKAEGNFYNLRGQVAVEKEAIEDAIIQVSVATESIKTGNKTKDKHARGKKWFNAEAFPKIEFNAASVNAINNTYVAEGTLTIKDISKKVSIPFDFLEQDGKTYLQGGFTINREDFNIDGNMFAFSVGKDVDVALLVPNDFNN